MGEAAAPKGDGDTGSVGGIAGVAGAETTGAFGSTVGVYDFGPAPPLSWMEAASDTIVLISTFGETGALPPETLP